MVELEVFLRGFRSKLQFYESHSDPFINIREEHNSSKKNRGRKNLIYYNVTIHYEHVLCIMYTYSVHNLYKSIRCKLLLVGIGLTGHLLQKKVWFGAQQEQATVEQLAQ